MVKKWIQGAIEHKGAFTAKAKRAHALTKNGTIKQSFKNKMSHSSNPTTRRQANLAKTLSHLGK